ncbi:MAG: M12 family metallopeptidase [Acidobacteriota bacterium]
MLPARAAADEFPLVWTTQAATAAPGDAGEWGDMLATGPLPKPVWHSSADGAEFSRLRFASNGAALRLYFDAFHLPKGARLFLYGLDAAGAVTCRYGPYTGAGPLDTGEFRSKIVAGVEAVVELQGRQQDDWPFSVARIGRMDEATLAWLREIGDPGLRETEAERAPARGELRTGFYRGKQVVYEVKDGLAIFEGDIILGRAEEIEAAQPGQPKSSRREAVGISGAQYRWPGGVIPIVIDLSLYIRQPNGVLTIDPRIVAALTHWGVNVPGILKLRANEADYVVLRSAVSGCSSSVGRRGGVQYVNISAGCSVGNAIHEIGHSAMLWHEHTREDRDNFVTINGDNIQAGYASQFTQHIDDGDDIGAYDYGSIMHYGQFAFSSNGNATITPLQADAVIGQRDGLSALDIAGIQALNCVYAVAPISLGVRFEGGNATVSVTAPSYCSWTATEGVGWLSITAGAAGTGNGTVTVTVSRNPVRHRRSATITVAGKTVAVFQGAAF